MKSIALRLSSILFVTFVCSAVFALVPNTNAQNSQTSQPTPSPTPKKTKEDDTIIIPIDIVSLRVSVFDQYGRAVTGLTKNAFTVFDNDEKQTIASFSDEDAPVSVGVIFDVSGSMSGDKIKRARDALKKFIETSHDDDEYFLIGFNSRAQLLLDKTRDGDAVINKLTFVQPKSTTALYDACYLGVEKVLRGAHPKRALLLISDGQDNNSRYTFKELTRLLKESDVTIYAIGILGGGDYGSALGMQGQSFLDEMASITGGKTFFPNSGEEMDDAFYRIATELRYQYSIGFYPSNFTNNGKYHKIKVKVTPPRGMPRLNVRTKDGYYALTNPK
jgi:Ca-activated chloride channel family protein